MLKKRGVSINGILHTGTDLDLLLISREDPMPEAKLLTTDIIGVNGLTDYTEHGGLLVTYQNRNPAFHFFTTGSRQKIETAFQRLAAFHGQTVSVTFDDDPKYYYHGRAEVIRGEAGATYAYFDLYISAYPYKLKHEQTLIEYATQGTETIIIHNNIMPVKLTAKVLSVTDPNPSASATYAVQFAYNSKTAVVNVGQEKALTGIIFKGGDQQITVKAGRMSNGGLNEYNYAARFLLIYQEGKL